MVVILKRGLCVAQTGVISQGHSYTALRAEKCLRHSLDGGAPLFTALWLRVPYHREKEQERVRGLRPKEGGQLDPDWEPRESEKEAGVQRERPFRYTRKVLMGALRNLS